jgi:hypothetical protein
MNWGEFSYIQTPFGLVNTRETFQQAMDITFKGIIGQSVVIYLCDVIVYSKKIFFHSHHPKKIFKICRIYVISLNTNKRVFFISEEKLLGHILSKYGVFVDPKFTKDIMNIPFPNNKKSIQSLFRKINFVRRFMSDFAMIVKPIQHMI